MNKQHFLKLVNLKYERIDIFHPFLAYLALGNSFLKEEFIREEEI